MADVFGESLFNDKITAYNGLEATEVTSETLISQDLFSTGSSNLNNLNVVGVSTFQDINLRNATASNITVSGISTLGNTVVGGATTQLVVNGNARITGILTIGTSSLTFDGTENKITGLSSVVTAGTGVTFVNSAGIGSMVLTPATNRFTVNNAGFYINANTGQLELTAAGFDLGFDGVNVIPRNKTKVTFTFSASDQSWTVPAGVTHIYAKLWGAGGGGGHFGGWSFGSWGGGGGHTRGIIPVTAGETLTIRVPRGGFAVPGTTNAPFGGGTATSGGDNQYAAGGGGYCGIFRSSTPLLIAGAGGGGGSVTGSHATCNGGAGGGYNGLRGESRDGATGFAGGGGTQSAGGTAGNGGNTGGGAGSSLQGGSVQGNNYGGGGGGGYYGGGSGSYGNGNTMAGGGGGSGFIATTVLLGATFCGRGAYPAGMDDIDYPPSSTSTYSSIGFGGVQRNNGGDGYLVIYY